MSVPIEIKNVHKRYGENVVIPDLSVNIRKGEFFTLLGPSGCGKTTLLRMIAGFVEMNAGEVRFGDETINDLPVYSRDIGMVFQNYAIFPNMTVGKNVEYGLRNRNISRGESRSRVLEMLEKVRMESLVDRQPENLSGGQQQRVALARAVVIHPRVLLMDEPLSNLDAQLRVEVRKVISDIQNEVGITTVYVTHDQEEALAISDRIAVMNKGVIQQIDVPEDIYRRPYNEFVATFIGRSAFFSAEIVDITGDAATLRLHDSTYVCEIRNIVSGLKPQDQVKIAVRPEEFKVVDGPSDLYGEVIIKQFLGSHISYEVLGPEGVRFEVHQSTDRSMRIYEPGERINLGLYLDRVNLYDQDGVTLIRGVKQNAYEPANS